MKILVTADLHYNIQRSRAPAEALAERVCATPADALVLLGDSAGADYRAFGDCLRLFRGFAGQKLLVPGNHCLWCNAEEDSLTRYLCTLPELARDEGFLVLDHAPQVLGSVGLVGSIGWYDYSFREAHLNVPLPFYQAKIAPGAAGYFTEHSHLLATHEGELSAGHREITTRWMDGQHVRLGMSDEAFTARLADTLARQMADLARRVEHILVFMHHLPFAELVPQGRPAKFAFAMAYMGSRRFGQALLAEPRVRSVLCGHSHWPARAQVGHVQAVSLGCTYQEKHLAQIIVSKGETTIEIV